MKKEGKRNKFVKAGFVTVIIIFGVAIGLIVSNIYWAVETNKNNDDIEVEWILLQTVSSDALGDYPAGGEGWLSTFCLDYAETPDSVLANNATDWSSDARARGFVDADNQETDLASEDPTYFCVKAVFDDDAKDSGSWNNSRFRVNLTISGDETISDVGEYDNSTTDGDAVICANSSTNIWIVFYWDDNDDGYRILDDGSLVWSISIYERK